MARLAVFSGALAVLACGVVAAAILAPEASRAALTTTGATTTAASTTVVSTAPEVLAVTGHGWGHGLGMSQWGAYGYAKHGWTYDRILAHYYTGTTLGAAKVATVRVLVAQERSTTLTSTSPWTLTDEAGARTALPAGSLALGPKLTVAAAHGASAPLTFTSTQPLSVDGHAYRGKLVVTSDGKQLSVVDVVGLEAYVKGVVPAEMPSSWLPEALEAQAVATRSYALANLQKGKPFDLYGDTRSQMYGGVAAEAPSSDAATDATKGQVVLYAGKVADTLFFSTSGGRTASALESTGINVPYLVPVADPYDSLSPYHDWGPVLFDATKVAKELKLSAPIAGLQAVDGPSGRVKTLTLTTSDESTVSLTGNQVRSDLDLNSTWFAPALLELLPAAKTMTYGGAVTLTGLASGAAPVSLEAKPSTAAAWAPAGDLVPDADGDFTTIVKPVVSTSYRLAWGPVRVGLAKVAVAARVAATATSAGAQGTVRPLAAGAPVQLQSLGAGGAWSTVSSTTTDTTSAWRFAGPLAAGTYRVRAAPGHGVVAGVSTSFVVQ